MTAIEVVGLTKRYGSLAAVDDLDLTVAAGTTYALLGPNGAGKTTTIEILEGLRSRDAGSVSVLGHDPATDPVAMHRRVGVMLQEGGLAPGAKVGELLALFAAFHEDPISPAALLALVGLEGSERTLVRRLSGGQRQRLSLAVALVGRPEVAFLDEPTAGMDPVARRATWATIEGLNADGVTVVLTTHHLDEAEHLADRVGIMAGGRLLAEGTPAELVASFGKVHFTTEHPVDTDGLSDLLGTLVEGDGRHHRVDLEATPTVMAAIARWAESRGVLLTELRVGAAGLEDAFLAITGHGAADKGSDPGPTGEGAS